MPKTASSGRYRATEGMDMSTIGVLSRAADQMRRNPDSIRAAPKPKGTLTHAAADLIRRGSLALGSSERDAVQRAHRFEEWNQEWNPLSSADMVGTQLRRKASGDRDFDKGALAQGAIGSALAVAPEFAAPAVKALAKTGVGKKVAGVLSKASPIVDDDVVEGAAKVVRTKTKDAPLRPVRTKDGAIPQPAPAPRGVLSTPDETTIPVRHYSHKRDLTEADPNRMGSNPSKNMSRSELSQQRRVYLGENRGLPTDYDKSKDIGIGPYSYDGAIPERKVVTVGSPQHQMFKNIMDEIAADPAKMKAWGFNDFDSAQTMVERLQQSAGFTARRFPSEYTPYGAAVHSFEPVALTRTAETPLAGQPLKLDAQGPHQGLRDAARGYMADARIPYRPSSAYLDVDPARGRAIADAYEAMPHAPEDPEVQKAYGALASETLGQYEALKRDGYTFDFYPRDEAGNIADPYASPFDALREVRGDGKTMKVYPTDAGYGSDGSGITDQMIAENPMLGLVPNETWGGQPVRVNDVFRAVHDAFGHAKDGVGFRASGEENAWNAHRAMYTPTAQRAMTTETRGQNSWLNFGPHGEANRTAATEDTVFAPQKIGLLPDWVLDPNGMPNP